MRNKFLTLDWGQIHYRVLGKGTPILLLHASPSSGKMLLPLAQHLAERHLVIIPDTPGYGLSNAMPIASPDLTDYADALRQFTDGLGLRTFCLYGTATGAQLAIRYAIRFPEQVSHVFLDNAAHFEDSQREAILKDYFPDLSARLDGTHLPQLWKMVRGLFTHFPWCWSQEEYRLSGPVPPAPILQLITLDYLQAGSGYDRAYRAAFQHEKGGNVQKLIVPTTIFRWEGSILLKYIDALLAHDFAAHIQAVDIVAHPQKRLEQMAAHIADTAATLTTAELSQYNTPVSKFQQHYWSTPMGQLHGWWQVGEGKNITLIFHDWGSSAAVSKMCYSDDNCWFVSLPGHGDSDAWREDTTGQSLIDALQEWLQSYQEYEFELTGMGWGWQLAEAVSKQTKYQLKEEIPCPWKHTLSPLVPTEDGTHLVKQWQAWQTALLPQIESNTDVNQLELLTTCFLEAWKCKVSPSTKPDFV